MKKHSEAHNAEECFVFRRSRGSWGSLPEKRSNNNCFSGASLEPVVIRLGVPRVPQRPCERREPLEPPAEALGVPGDTQNSHVITGTYSFGTRCYPWNPRKYRDPCNA
jgi:hypothetical protein